MNIQAIRQEATRLMYWGTCEQNAAATEGLLKQAFGTIVVNSCYRTLVDRNIVYSKKPVLFCLK